MVPPDAARRTTALTMLAAVALLGAAACGSTGASGGSARSATPADAVRTGLAGLRSGNAATFTVRLDATAAQVQALDRASGRAVGSGVPTGGTLTLAVRAAGRSFAADQAAKGGIGTESFALTLNAGDAPGLLQIDRVGQAFYARGDVSALAGYAGAAGRRVVAQFTGGDLATRYPFVAAAVAGRWLRLDLPSLLDFARGTAPGAVPSVGPGAVASLESGLGAALHRDVTVTRAAADPARGEHLVLTGNARTLGGDLLGVLGSLPGAASLVGRANADRLPSTDIHLDAYVRGGVLDAVTLDLTPLLSPAEATAVHGAPIVAEVDITPTATVTAPTSVISVSTGQLLGFLAAVGSSSGGR